MGVGGQYDTTAALLSENRFGTHFVGGCMDLVDNVGGCGKTRFRRDSIPDLSIPSKSLYRLRYPGPFRGTGSRN